MRTESTGAWFSTNGGRAWAQRESPPAPDSMFGGVVTVAPTRGTVWYAIMDKYDSLLGWHGEQLYQTTDAGLTWTEQRERNQRDAWGESVWDTVLGRADLTPIVVSRTDPNVLFSLPGGTPNGASTDGGRTWFRKRSTAERGQQSPSPQCMPWIGRMFTQGVGGRGFVFSVESFEMLGDESVTLYSNRDSANTWGIDELPITVFNPSLLFAGAPADSDLFMLIEQGPMWHTPDFGLTWDTTEWQSIASFSHARSMWQFLVAPNPPCAQFAVVDTSISGHDLRLIMRPSFDAAWRFMPPIDTTVFDGLLTWDDLTWTLYATAPTGLWKWQPEASSVATPTPEVAFLTTVNFPDPVRTTTTLSLALPTSGSCDITLYDVLGRVVRHLYEGRLAAGRHDVTIDLSSLPPGTYTYLARGSGEIAARQLSIVR